MKTRRTQVTLNPKASSSFIIHNSYFILHTSAPPPYQSLMESNSTTEASAHRQALRSRIFWFIAGASLNYALIKAPFTYLQHHTAFPVWAISICSLAVSSSFFFLWNYFINFRTDSRRRDALARYIVAVIAMLLLSSVTLTLLKTFNFHMALTLGKFPIDLDIVATQFFLSGLKFFVYHRWVFPIRK